MENKKRTHNPAWKDSTRRERIQKRRDRLNEIARAAGYKSWSEYETAVINNQVQIQPR
jgi:hypothetical protein